ncbi:hypothetical protein CMV_021236 [Castanea mollissima]|uniref:Uncharacterized protein n=1 Tax=Castanea mollissima TaxID=60419 RepID=A0A8J4VLV1_9ROSI|nr:hypothetical protein CMV_021236 [Castanea mollissima]
MRNQDKPSYATHHDWYSSQLQSDSSLLYTHTVSYHGFVASFDSDRADSHTTRARKFLDLNTEFNSHTTQVLNQASNSQPPFPKPIWLPQLHPLDNPSGTNTSPPSMPVATFATIHSSPPSQATIILIACHQSHLPTMIDATTIILVFLLHCYQPSPTIKRLATRPNTTLSSLPLPFTTHHCNCHSTT